MKVLEKTKGGKQTDTTTTKLKYELIETLWPTMHLLKSLGSTPGRALMSSGNM